MPVCDISLDLVFKMELEPILESDADPGLKLESKAVCVIDRVDFVLLLLLLLLGTRTDVVIEMGDPGPDPGSDSGLERGLGLVVDEVVEKKVENEVVADADLAVVGD